jgi:hypothetical protein
MGLASYLKFQDQRLIMRVWSGNETLIWVSSFKSIWRLSVPRYKSVYYIMLIVCVTHSKLRLLLT